MDVFARINLYGVVFANDIVFIDESSNEISFKLELWRQIYRLLVIDKCLRLNIWNTYFSSTKRIEDIVSQEVFTRKKFYAFQICYLAKWRGDGVLLIK